MDLQKKLTELRNKVEQERIDLSSGSDIEEIVQGDNGRKKRESRNKDRSKKKITDKAEDVKVVTILDSDEEAADIKKKKREERKTKKRKRSR